MATYDNKSINGSGLTYFWSTIKALILGWIAPKQDHTLSGANDASKVLVTDGSKNIVTSSVTSTQLGYLGNVTSDVQTQINGKIASISADGTSGVTNLKTGTNVILSKSNADLTINGGPFSASCETVTGTAAKTATCSGYTLKTGNVIAVTFRYDAGAATSLNVNSTGAKPIKYRNNNLSSGLIRANDTVLFEYDGTNYDLINYNYVLPDADAQVRGGVMVGLGNVGSDAEGYCFDFGMLESHLCIKEATTENSGAMTSTMVTKLNGIEAGANNYTLPSMTSSALGGAKTNVLTTSDISKYTSTAVGIYSGTLQARVADSTGAGVMKLYSAVDQTSSSATDGTLTANAMTGYFAPLASPTLTGSPTATTATSSDNSTRIATTAFVQTVVQAAVSGATTFQGTINYQDSDTQHSELIQHGDFKAGEYWLVNTTGTIAGQACEGGDMVYCINSRTHTAGSAITTSDFAVVQKNLDFLTNSDIDAIIASVA